MLEAVVQHCQVVPSTGSKFDSARTLRAHDHASGKGLGQQYGLVAGVPRIDLRAASFAHHHWAAHLRPVAAKDHRHLPPPLLKLASEPLRYRGFAGSSDGQISYADDRNRSSGNAQQPEVVSKISQSDRRAVRHARRPQ
jgi:hypothetical protein